MYNSPNYLGGVMARVLLKGNPIETNGELPSIGSKAPDFKLVDKDLQDRSLSDFKDKWKVLSVVPSLDTPVCSLSAKKFNAASAEYNALILVISGDTPFAQKRMCGAEGLEHIITLSMLRDKEFAKNYGLLITTGPLAGLAARAVLLLDPANTIVYTELVPEITQEPNYDKVLSLINSF
jgi:thioredoxin-dependent peroxiredoxin